MLDLTRLLPGPVCTLYLADLGADVVKIEDTGAGDYARNLGNRPGTVSAFFRAVNRNKRSAAIDLKDPRGRDAFLALAQRADVDRRELPARRRRRRSASTTTTIARINPRIVYASISGYGQSGPRAQAAGHDINYLGYAGVLDQTGARDGPPALCNLQIADLLGGAATAAIAILAALVGAQRTGRGRYVDVAMADASLAHNIFALHALDAVGAHAAARRRSAHRRRPVLRRLSARRTAAGSPSARSRTSSGGAVRGDRSPRSRAAGVRAGRRRRARARASSKRSSAPRRSRIGQSVSPASTAA